MTRCRIQSLQGGALKPVQRHQFQQRHQSREPEHLPDSRGSTRTRTPARKGPSTPQKNKARCKTRFSGRAWWCCSKTVEV
eukprot:813716-Amphidinium_carterae.1